MRLTDADVLLETMRNALYKLEDDLEERFKGTELNDKWFLELRPAIQDGHAICINAVANAPTVEPEPARLLTEEDFVDNPDVDSWGYLPAWEEDRGLLPGEWSYADRADVFIKGRKRYWTSRPTQEQMAETPWEVGE